MTIMQKLDKLANMFAESIKREEEILAEIKKLIGKDEEEMKDND